MCKLDPRTSLTASDLNAGAIASDERIRPPLAVPFFHLDISIYRFTRSQDKRGFRRDSFCLQDNAEVSVGDHILTGPARTW